VIVGFIAGAFDLLHAGHILLLKDCKKYCDYLVVGLHYDPSVEREYKNSPVESILERQIRLMGCRFVDEVVVYNTEREMMTIVDNFDIDIRLVGGDHEFTDIKEKYLIETKYIPRNHPYSSSKLRRRIQE